MHYTSEGTLHTQLYWTEIGDELAAGRALSDLAHRLLDVAADDIEAFAASR